MQSTSLGRLRGFRITITVGLVALLLLGGSLVPRGASAAGRYPYHPYIYISGDDSFTAANGVRGGNGTASNPYVIEDWDITTTPADGGAILLFNVYKYFVIRNVTIHGTSDGIVMGNVINGRVEHVRITGGGFGIIVNGGGNLVIGNNSITGAGSDAIEVIECPSMDIEGNMVSGNARGIEAFYCTATVAHNIVLANKGDGIGLCCRADFSTLEGNIVAYNGGYGIYVADAYDTTIDHNIVFRNGYGIGFLGDARFNRAHHNDIVRNTVQAVDQPGSNAWDNGYPIGGNYWSDYTGRDLCSGPNQDVCPDPDGIGDIPYVIGPAAQDNYPLARPLPPGLLISAIQSPG